MCIGLARFSFALGWLGSAWLGSILLGSARICPRSERRDVLLNWPLRDARDTD